MADTDAARKAMAGDLATMMVGLIQTAEQLGKPTGDVQGRVMRMLFAFEGLLSEWCDEVRSFYLRVDALECLTPAALQEAEDYDEVQRYRSEAAEALREQLWYLEGSRDIGRHLFPPLMNGQFPGFPEATIPLPMMGTRAEHKTTQEQDE